MSGFIVSGGELVAGYVFGHGADKLAKTIKTDPNKHHDKNSKTVKKTVKKLTKNNKPVKHGTKHGHKHGTHKHGTHKHGTHKHGHIDVTFGNGGVGIQGGGGGGW